MPSFDFTSVPQRLGTDSQKWQKYPQGDILPLWVADMDFKSPPAVIEALRRRVEHGIFGYARPCRSTTEAVVAYCERRYGWSIDPAWIVWLPGLVVGLNVMAQAMAEPGDEVLCLTPVYAPFMTAPRHQGRVSRAVPMVLDGAKHRWEIDWGALERAVTPRTRLFYLCHPHNPLARVFSREDVQRLGSFCARHGLVLCSDEIHCDLILDDASHAPAASLGAELQKRTITLMAPSKTYNVPGLATSFAIVPDATLRARFLKANTGIVAEVNCLGYTACEAALTEGESWRQALLAALRANRDLLLRTLETEMPGVRVEAPIEATYLAWLNVRALGWSDPVRVFESRGVGLTDGSIFGAARGHYVRLNFGCPEATLREALARMARAVREVGPAPEEACRAPNVTKT